MLSSDRFAVLLLNCGDRVTLEPLRKTLRTTNSVTAWSLVEPRDCRKEEGRGAISFCPNAPFVSHVPTPTPAGGAVARFSEPSVRGQECRRHGWLSAEPERSEG